MNEEKGQQYCNQNFVLLMESHIDQSIIDKFLNLEMVESIMNEEMGYRPSNATGYFTPGDTSKNFSQLTQKDRSLLIASKVGV